MVSINFSAMLHLSSSAILEDEGNQALILAEAATFIAVDAIGLRRFAPTQTPTLEKIAKPLCDSILALRWIIRAYQASRILESSHPIVNPFPNPEMVVLNTAVKVLTAFSEIACFTVLDNYLEKANHPTGNTWANFFAVNPNQMQLQLNQQEEPAARPGPLG